MRIFASCQCADYARVSYVDAVEARVARVMPMFVLSHSLIRMCYVCLVGKAVWCLLRWPHRAVVPNLHLHRQRMLLSAINYIYRSRVYQTV